MGGHQYTNFRLEPCDLHDLCSSWGVRTLIQSPAFTITGSDSGWHPTHPSSQWVSVTFPWALQFIKKAVMGRLSRMTLIKVSGTVIQGFLSVIPLCQICFCVSWLVTSASSLPNYKCTYYYYFIKKKEGQHFFFTACPRLTSRDVRVWWAAGKAVRHRSQAQQLLEGRSWHLPEAWAGWLPHWVQRNMVNAGWRGCNSWGACSSTSLSSSSRSTFYVTCITSWGRKC